MKKASLFLLLLFSNSLYTKVIIWDLGGVLLKTDKWVIAHSIGIRHFLRYMLFDWKSPNIQPLLFSILDNLHPIENYNQERAVGADGVLFPPVICQWQAGQKTAHEIRIQVHKRIAELDEQNFFLSAREKLLIEKTIDVMFDSLVLARSTIVRKQGIRLLKECAEAVHEDGTPKHTLMVLSNWDDLSFDLVYKQYPEVFQYFSKEHVIISSAIGFIKPQKEAFSYIFKKFNIDPQDCIFIDDQDVNIQAAQALGITGLLLHKGNYISLRAQLIKLGVL